MYSRTQHRDLRDFRLPEHYSGVAFDRARPLAVRQPEACADGLPAAGIPSVPAPKPMSSPVPVPEEENAPPVTEVKGEGLFGGIGTEELLLLGIIFLLAQRPGEDDTILLLLLLLLRH